MFWLETPLSRPFVLIITIIIASFTGITLDQFTGYTSDNWIHDAALVHQHRQRWDYVSLVVLDKDVPFSVSRKQALPLYAKAADRLIAAGAKGIFLDARISKEMDSRIAFARCIASDGQVQWVEPSCEISTEQQCTVHTGRKLGAPLRMNDSTLKKFSIAPYMGNPDLPDFLIYDWGGAFAIPEKGLVASDRLVTKDDPIARWFDLSKDHAIFKLATFIQPLSTNTLPETFIEDEICDSQRLCRRVRLSKPQFGTQIQGSHPIIPVSLLASCDTKLAEQTAKLAKDRLIIFQLTSPEESTDLLVTPMTNSWFGPQKMSFGAQYLADSVETLLKLDHPRAPPQWLKISMLVLSAIIGVITAAYLRQYLVWSLAICLFFLLIALCILNPLVQLWPVSATMLSFLMGAGQLTGLHLVLGFRHGKLTASYMPKQIRSLLLNLKTGESFQNRRCTAVVLMSDLAGYTTLTGLLKEPEHILELMNDYLSATSIVLQDKYNGWLESYVGDMVCYYWPYKDEEKLTAHHLALQGALELAALQKQFFSSLPERYHSQINAETLQKMQSFINAGIGISAGPVVMGNLGPSHSQGLKKFGILGDPLNLASRIESLTRHFNTEIIISAEFIDLQEPNSFALRRLGCIKVKGRATPETLFALGDQNDPRCNPIHISSWHTWLQAVEEGQTTLPEYPDIYKQDVDTINNWLDRHLLHTDGIWYLDEK